MVTAKLICVFVFAYAKCLFSHDEAQMFYSPSMLILLSIKIHESVISVGPQFANHLTALIPSCIESCKQSRGKPSSQCKLCEAIVSEPRLQRRMVLVVNFFSNF